MASRPPPPGVYRTASGTPSRAPTSNTVSAHTSRSPSALAPPGAAPNISFLCHYAVVGATINDKVVTITKDSPNAAPKQMTHTSQHQLSSNILSLISIPPSTGGNSNGGSVGTLFAPHGNTLTPSAAATRLPTTPVPTPPSFPNATQPIINDIIIAFNEGVRGKINPKPPAPKDGDLETPQDRTGLGIAQDSFSVDQTGFLGLVLRDTSKAIINAVFNLNRLLDVSIVVGGEGLPATTMPPGNFSSGLQQDTLSAGYNAEETLGVLQSLVDSARSTKKAIKLQLLFAHHSETLRNITLSGLPPAMSNIKSMTSLILDLAPFPAGTQLMLTEEGAGTKTVCSAAPALVEAMANHYRQQVAELGLGALLPKTALPGKPRPYLMGQQTQLPQIDSQSDERISLAIAQSLGKLSAGSFSTFSATGIHRRRGSEDPHNTSLGGVVRVESTRSTRAATPTEGNGATFSAVCPAGPQSLLSPAVTDALIVTTSEVFRKRNNKGPCPPIKDLGPESSTTTTANHIATAVKNFLMFGATAPPPSSSSNAESGSTWVLVAFLQHALILMDANIKTTQNSRSIMNPPVATIIENRFRPLLIAASGVVIELINNENERRAAEAQRLANIAAKNAMDASHDSERQEMEEEEGDGRTIIETDLQNSFEAIEKQSNDDKRRIASILLDQRRAADASAAKEHDRLKSITDRFGRVLLQLQQDEMVHRQEYSRQEVQQRVAIYNSYLNEGFLFAQFQARRDFRLSERPGRLTLWDEEKRCRTELYYYIRQLQLQFYAEKKRKAHEAAHQKAYREQVQLMGELSTLNERYHQLQYVRARLEAEVLEKESKFLNRPHADALAQIVGTIVQRQSTSTKQNERLFSSFGGGFSSSPMRRNPFMATAAQTMSPQRQQPTGTTMLSVPSLVQEDVEMDIL